MRRSSIALVAASVCLAILLAIAWAQRSDRRSQDAARTPRVPEPMTPRPSAPAAPLPGAEQPLDPADDVDEAVIQEIEQKAERYRAEQLALVKGRTAESPPGPDPLATAVKTFRNRFPKATRRLPEGTDASTFAAATVAELAAFPLGGGYKARPEENQRKQELLDALAETAAGDESVRRALMDLARSGDKAPRQVAIMILGRLPTADALDFLIHEGLRFPDPWARETVVMSLRQDQGWNVRYGAMEGNYWEEDPPGPVANPQIAAALVRAAGTETDRRTLVELIGALKKQLHDGPLDGPEGAADRDAHPEGMHYAAEARAALLDMKRRVADPKVQDRLLETLARIDSSEAANEVLAALRSARTSDERANAIRAVASVKAVGVDRARLVLDAFRDPDEGVRFAAVQSSGVLGRDEEAFNAMNELMDRAGSRPEVAATAFHTAVNNLLATQTRFGSPATPDPVRALELADRVLTARGTDSSFRDAGAVVVRTLERLVMARRFVPSAEQAATLDRLQRLVGRK